MEQDLLAAIAPYFCANAGLVVRLKSEKDKPRRDVPHPGLLYWKLLPEMLRLQLA